MLWMKMDQARGKNERDSDYLLSRNTIERNLLFSCVAKTSSSQFRSAIRMLMNIQTLNHKIYYLAAAFNKILHYDNNKSLITYECFYQRY